MTSHADRMPRVSVCVMSFNHAPYIAGCLRSALAQAGDVDLEILVGDDHSSDGTPTVISSIAGLNPGLVRPFLHARRMGPAGNYRFLIRQARGEFIAHLDGDDAWLPGKLQRQIALLDEDAGLSGVYTNATVIDRQGSPLGVFNSGIPSRLGLADLVRQGSRLNNSSCVYRSRLAGEVLRPDRDLLDYDVQLALARRGDIAYVDSALSVYRLGSESSMLLNHNATVRELYWRALSDVSAAVAPGIIARGMAVFLRSVFFRTLSTRDPGLLMSWWPRVREDAPVSPLELTALTAAEILKTVSRLATMRLAEFFMGRPRVLYP